MYIFGRIAFPVFVFFMLCFSGANGQKHELGFGLGAYNYVGEISPDYNFAFSRPAMNVFYRWNISPVISIRPSATFGYIYASEKHSKDPVASLRHKTFSSFIGVGSIMAEYNFFNYREDLFSKLLKTPYQRRYTPYLTGGIGFFGFSSNDYDIANDNTAINFTIPFGVGLKYQLTRQWNLNFEFTANKTVSDKVDGISKGVVNFQQLGNPVDMDWFFYTGVSLSYTFTDVVCPEHHYGIK